MTSGVTKLSEKKWKKWLHQIIPLSPTHIRELAVTCRGFIPCNRGAQLLNFKSRCTMPKLCKYDKPNITSRYLPVFPSSHARFCKKEVGQGIKFNHQKARGKTTFLLGGAAFIFSRVFSYEDCTFHRWVFPSQKKEFHSHTHRDWDTFLPFPSISLGGGNWRISFFHTTLMLQESGEKPPGMYKNPVNDGIFWFSISAGWPELWTIQQ